MRRLQRHTGVEGRYLSLPLQAYINLATWGETNNLWIQTAVELGQRPSAALSIGLVWRRAIWELSFLPP
jgi:predicted naringenin-chalcone synthase